MKNTKRYVYFALFIILLTSVFGVRALLNNNPVDQSEKEISESISKNKEIKVFFVELGSVGCVPCDKMQPIMKEIEEEFKDQVSVVFHDVKTEEGKPYIKEFGIRAIPTQIFLDKDEKEFFRHLGFLSKDEIIKVLRTQGVTE